MPARLARLLILPALPEFHQCYPDIELELGVSDPRIDIIGEGVDLALRAGTLEDSNLIARSLGCFEIVTLASPDYLARFGVPQTLRNSVTTRWWAICYPQVSYRAAGVQARGEIPSIHLAPKHKNQWYRCLYCRRIGRLWSYPGTHLWYSATFAKWRSGASVTAVSAASHATVAYLSTQTPPQPQTEAVYRLAGATLRRQVTT